MTTVECLEELQKRALADGTLRARLIETREDPEPLGAFCRLCRELGYDIYPMEVIEAGEEFYATYRRSTNGGGENSPKLKGEDDFYEMFFAMLEAAEQEERKEEMR